MGKRMTIRREVETVDPQTGETVKRVIHHLPRQHRTISDAELYDELVRWQETTTAAFPRTLEHDVEVPATDGRPICVAFPSDWHIGNEGTDLRRLREDITLITRHPRLYCAVGGDPIDNFILAKMISASRTQSAQVRVQWRLFRYLVGLLHDSGSLLWVSSGNHDAWTKMVAGVDGIASALADIPVCNTQEGGLIRLKVGEQVYSIYRKHRPQGFTSRLNNTHFLKQMLRFGAPWAFDVGVSEHIHNAGMEVLEHKGKQVVMLCCGSYKIVDDWATDNGFYGGGYGVPCCVFYPGERRMVPFMSIADAVEYLDRPTATGKTMAGERRAA